MPAPASLDELLRILQDLPDPPFLPTYWDIIEYEDQIADYASGHGLLMKDGYLDMTNLPSFGGKQPADRTGVWSWDAQRLLVGTCTMGFEIVART